MAKTHHILAYANTFVTLAAIIVISILWWQDAIPIELVTTNYCNHQTNDCDTYYDAINVAVQIGRLDMVTIALAFWVLHLD
ncbi:MAG: hypothetical protein AB8D52_06225 [Gammaproteobacteria bacterium]